MANKKSKEPYANLKNNRLVLLHVPKTAGTSLRQTIEPTLPKDFVISQFRYRNKFDESNYNKYNFISAHIGFDLCSKFDGDIITVVRHPIERILSVYYFWRQIAINNPESQAGQSQGPKFAASVSLKEFVTSKHRFVTEEIENRQTWQLAYGHHMNQRKEKKSEWNDDDVLKQAIENVNKLALVGIQEDFDQFLDDYYNKYNVRLEMKKANITKKRKSYFDISTELKRAIYNRCFLDVELYYYIFRKTKGLE